MKYPSFIFDVFLGIDVNLIQFSLFLLGQRLRSFEVVKPFEESSDQRVMDDKVLENHQRPDEVD